MAEGSKIGNLYYTISIDRDSLQKVREELKKVGEQTAKSANEMSKATESTKRFSQATEEAQSAAAEIDERIMEEVMILRELQKELKDLENLYAAQKITSAEYADSTTRIGNAAEASRINLFDLAEEVAEFGGDTKLLKDGLEATSNIFKRVREDTEELGVAFESSGLRIEDISLAIGKLENDFSLLASRMDQMEPDEVAAELASLEARAESLSEPLMLLSTTMDKTAVGEKRLSDATVKLEKQKKKLREESAKLSPALSQLEGDFMELSSSAETLAAKESLLSKQRQTQQITTQEYADSIRSLLAQLELLESGYVEIGASQEQFENKTLRLIKAEDKLASSKIKLLKALNEANRELDEVGQSSSVAEAQYNKLRAGIDDLALSQEDAINLFRAGKISSAELVVQLEKNEAKAEEYRQALIALKDSGEAFEGSEKKLAIAIRDSSRAMDVAANTSKKYAESTEIIEPLFQDLRSDIKILSNDMKQLFSRRDLISQEEFEEGLLGILIRAESLGIHLGELRVEMDGTREGMVRTSSAARDLAMISGKVESEFDKIASEADRTRASFGNLGQGFFDVKDRAEVLVNEIAALSSRLDSGRGDIAALAAELQEKRQALMAVNMEMSEYRSISNLTAKEQAILTGSIKRNEQAYRSATNSLKKHTGEMTKQAMAANLSYGGLTLLQDRIFQISPALGIFTNQLMFTEKGLRAMLAAMLPVLAVAGSIIAVFGTLAISIAQGSRLDTALANVRKTTNLTTQELESLTNQFQDISMEIPIAVSELLDMAQVAGQLGITGVDNISRFADTVARLAIATDVVGEQGATSLARFLQATGTEMENMGREAERAANVLNQLENTTASTAAEILQMTSYTQGLSSQANFTNDEILGLNAALLSLGVKAEAGGSAVVRTMSKIQQASSEGGSEIKMFAEEAGITVEQFDLLVRNSPLEALMQLARGMNATAEAGGSLNDILTKLGINEVRERRTLLALAQGYSTFESAISSARQESFLMNSLNQEVAVQSETLASKLLLLRNRFTATAQNIGRVVVPQVKALVDGLIVLVSVLDELTIAIASVSSVLVGAGLLRSMDTIAAKATALATFFGDLILRIRLLWITITGLATSLGGPVTWAIAGITALVGTGAYVAFNKLRDGAKDLKEEMESLSETTSEAQDVFNRVADENDLYAAIDAVTKLLDGEAKAAWLDYATYAVENIGSVEDRVGFLSERLTEILRQIAEVNVEAARVEAEEAINLNLIQAGVRPSLDFLMTEEGFASLRQLRLELESQLSGAGILARGQIQRDIEDIDKLSLALANLTSAEIQLQLTSIDIEEDGVVGDTKEAVGSVIARIANTVQGEIDELQRLSPSVDFTELELLENYRDLWKKEYEKARDSGEFSAEVVEAIYQQFFQLDRAAAEAKEFSEQSKNAFEEASGEFSIGLRSLELRGLTDPTMAAGGEGYLQALVNLWEGYRGRLESIIVDPESSAELKAQAEAALFGPVSEGLASANAMLAKAIERGEFDPSDALEALRQQRISMGEVTGAAPLIADLEAIAEARDRAAQQRRFVSAQLERGEIDAAEALRKELEIQSQLVSDLAEGYGSEYTPQVLRAKEAQEELQAQLARTERQQQRLAEAQENSLETLRLLREANSEIDGPPPTATGQWSKYRDAVSNAEARISEIENAFRLGLIDSVEMANQKISVQQDLLDEMIGLYGRFHPLVMALAEGIKEETEAVEQLIIARNAHLARQQAEENAAKALADAISVRVQSEVDLNQQLYDGRISQEEYISSMIEVVTAQYEAAIAADKNSETSIRLRNELDSLAMVYKNLTGEVENYEKASSGVQAELSLGLISEPEALSRQIDLVNKSVLALTTSFYAGEISAGQFQNEMAALRAEFVMLNQRLDELGEFDALDELAKGFKEIFGILSSFDDGPFGDFMGFASGLIDKAPDIYDGLKKIAQGFKEGSSEASKESISEGLAIVFGTLESILPDYESATNRFIKATLEMTGALVGGFIAGPQGAQAGAAIGSFIGDIIGDLSNGIEEIRKQVEETVSSTNYLSQSLVQAFADASTKTVNRGGVVGAYGATKKELDEEAFNAFLDIAQPIAAGLAGALRRGIDGAIRGDTEWKDNLRKSLRESMVEQIMMTFLETTLAGGAFDEFIKGFTERLKAGDIDGAMEYLNENFDEVASKMEGRVDEFASKVGDSFKEAAETLGEAIERVGESALSSFNNLTQSVIDEIINNAIKGEEIDEALFQKMASIADSLAGTFSGAIRTGINQALSGSLDWQKNLREGLKSAILTAIVDAFLQASLMQGVLGGFFTEFSRRISEESLESALNYAESELPDLVEDAFSMVDRLVDIIPDALKPDESGEGGITAGTQISEITGPTRDLLTDLLTPLSILPSWTSMIRDIRNDVRSIASGSGTMSMANVGGLPMSTPVMNTGSIQSQTIVIQNATITTQAKNAKQLYDELSKQAYKETKGGKG